MKHALCMYVCDVVSAYTAHMHSAGGQAAADELPGAPSVRTAADLESEVRAAAAEAAARHGAVPLSSVKVRMSDVGSVPLYYNRACVGVGEKNHACWHLVAAIPSPQHSPPHHTLMLCTHATHHHCAVLSGAQGPVTSLLAPSKRCCLAPSACACPQSCGSPLQRGWQHRRTLLVVGNLLRRGSGGMRCVCWCGCMWVYIEGRRCVVMCLKIVALKSALKNVKCRINHPFPLMTPRCNPRLRMCTGQLLGGSSPGATSRQTLTLLRHRHWRLGPLAQSTWRCLMQRSSRYSP